MTDEYEGIDEDSVHLDKSVWHVRFHHEDDDESHALCVCWKHVGAPNAVELADHLVSLNPPPADYVWKEDACPTCKWLVQQALEKLA